MDLLAAIRRDVDRFYTAADRADPAARVPSCPEWTVADLVWHLGGVHRFWGTDIERRAAAPEEAEEQLDRPEAFGDLVAWGRAQADRMLALLATTADDVPVWTWALSSSDHDVGFIRRHQVQEAAVHRWDMEQAASGQPQPIEPDVAADSVDEMLAMTLPWGVKPETPLAGSVHVHCTDTVGEWFIHPDGRVEAIHAKGDVAMRGTASDILLALYTRVPITALEVIGDAGLADELVARLGTE